jgi:lysophospholipid acyltransferase (LPLAT)-like uncharacterized protein
VALLKRVRDAGWLRATVAVLASHYLRLVWKTSRFVIEPEDFYERVEPQLPVIIAMWHGQHFMMPFVRRHHRVKVLISRHRDGEINAIAAQRLGIQTIRGSGDHYRRFDRKGGVGAFKAMLAALQDGWTMALTADIPKVSRKAGPGIVKLAQFSGRPIIPVAVATSRRIEAKNWDRSVANLPFSRGAMVFGDPIRVPADADANAIETARQAVESALTAATLRAYEIVDRRSSGRG